MRFPIYASILLLLTMTLATVSGAAAYGQPAQEYLVSFVFVPWEHKNVDFRYLSFSDLNDITLMAQGNAWNDMDALCESMRLKFGAYGAGCGRYNPPTIIPPASARAIVAFTILPSPPTPVVVVPPKRVMYVDPVYPPWPPTYNPYW